MEVDDNILLMVSDPQGILCKHLRPHSVLLLYNVIILFNYAKMYIIRLLNYFLNWGPSHLTAVVGLKPELKELQLLLLYNLL